MEVPVPLPNSANPAPCLHKCRWTKPYTDLCWPRKPSGDGYKYGGVSSDAPFADAMNKVHESETPANFSQQGSVIGKTKGRKPKTADPKSKAEPKPKASRKRASGSAEEPNGGAKRRRRTPRQPENPGKEGPAMMVYEIFGNNFFITITSGFSMQSRSQRKGQLTSRRMLLSSSLFG